MRFFMPQACNLQVCGIFCVPGIIQWFLEVFFLTFQGRNHHEWEKTGSESTSERLGTYQGEQGLIHVHGADAGVQPVLCLHHHALGQSDVSRIAMKGAFGTGIACGAATLAGLFGADSVSGCLFF